ncbi:LOW QUALITY PROTEIN: uncharacterized protein LOC144344647 [Saccoglossus kowalevskii]
MMGHAERLHFKCYITSSSHHSLPLHSSSTLPNGKLLVNYRMLHAVTTSGIRDERYTKFCEAANIGVIGRAYKQTFKYYIIINAPIMLIISTLAEESRNDALLQEIAYDDNRRGGIDVMSDARHSTRKNAKQSEIVFLGDRTHKCIYKTVVTRNDDTCSQRHEMAGVRRFYQWADNKDVPIIVHAHDRSMSVNKFLGDERQDTINANDTWHVTKQIGKQVKSITTGAQSRHGKTWHTELSDKGASIKTHFYWSMKSAKKFMGSENTNMDTRSEACQALRTSLDNIVNHYQNNHADCSLASRCRRQADYEPSFRVMRNQVAINLLSKFIKNTIIYKQADSYVECKDTHYVESYNNVCLLYQDKPVVFGNETYKLRSDLTCLDWNENVDRLTTSLATRQDARAPRRRAGRRVVVKKT